MASLRGVFGVGPNSCAASSTCSSTTAFTSASGGCGCLGFLLDPLGLVVPPLLEFLLLLDLLQRSLRHSFLDGNLLALLLRQDVGHRGPGIDTRGHRRTYWSVSDALHHWLRWLACCQGKGFGCQLLTVFGPSRHSYAWRSSRDSLPHGHGRPNRC
jgi:hypothetical protein